MSSDPPARADDDDCACSLADPIKKGIDDIFEFLNRSEYLYSRKNMQVSTLTSTIKKIAAFIDTVSDERERIVAEIYAGLIKIDKNTFMIRCKTISSKMGISRASLNVFLSNIHANNVARDEGNEIKNCVTKKGIIPPKNKRQWSVRRTEKPIFEEDEECSNKEEDKETKNDESSTIAFTTQNQLKEKIDNIPKRFREFECYFNSACGYKDNIFNPFFGESIDGIFF